MSYHTPARPSRKLTTNGTIGSPVKSSPEANRQHSEQRGMTGESRTTLEKVQEEVPGEKQKAGEEMRRTSLEGGCSPETRADTENFVQCESEIPLRTLKAGSCKKGNKCEFSHDLGWRGMCTRISLVRYSQLHSNLQATHR